MSTSHLAARSDFPRLPGVGAAMQRMIDAQEIAGAVTLVQGRDEIVHLETTGFADVAAGVPVRADTIFWIASMTKPVTAVAVMMLQDEGKLDVTDPVAKYIPEFADLKTPSGKPANLTLVHLLTHTSGMGYAEGRDEHVATLAECIPFFLAAPMHFEPGTRWEYCQSAINTAARIVEVASGQSFDTFLEERLFQPLGMKDTGFYPPLEAAGRMTRAYTRNPDTGKFELGQRRYEPGTHDRPPRGNGGLFSTALDYARFCRMLLNGGQLDGKRYLSPESLALMTRDHTSPLDAGFVPGSAWGLGVGLVREPQGITAMLSPGTFGHGGAHGTQAWIDPTKGVSYILMVQRTNFPNSDASDVRRAFQEAAAAAMFGTQ